MATWTVWVCAACGTEYPYRDTQTHHGGPHNRSVDNRYGFLVSCWRSKKSKCPTHNRKLTGTRVILLSPVAPNPAQPEQDLDQIQYGPKRRKA